MRDPDRIFTILNLLYLYWEQNPDMRLGQIVGNCYGVGSPYYMEDDKIEDYLRREIERGLPISPGSKA